MALVKLQVSPGVTNEVTSLGAKGYWFDSNNVRFVTGSPEKIGGWVLDGGTVAETLMPPAGQNPPARFWGTARALFNWTSIRSDNLLAIGTNFKYYVQNSSGGYYHDVTPIRTTTVVGDITFLASPGTPTITVTDALPHGAATGAFVTFSGAVGLGGNITAGVLNSEFQVTQVLTDTTFTITAPANATGADVGDGGASVVATFQLNPLFSNPLPQVGWGAGGWGGSTLGSAFTTGWGESRSPDSSTPFTVWSQSNYGQNLVMTNGLTGIYYWVIDDNPGTFNRAQVLSPNNNNTQDGVQYWKTDGGNASCPTIANLVLVSDQSRFVIAFGTDNNGDGTQDPMLISWSDQENITVWSPLPTNQAGNYRLSIGSKIVAAKQTQQQILVWTDKALYSMQYVGAPYVWSFTPMTDNITIAGQNVAVYANNAMYWMGTDKFYVFNGSANTLPCNVRKYVFNNINRSQGTQFFGGLNSAFNEVWWFYCSAFSNVIDKYVIYNYLDNVWSYGSMTRTAWLYSSLRQYPIAAGLSVDGVNGNLLYHENGTDNGQTIPATPINSFVQAADVDIADGDSYAFGWRLIPDVSFDYSTSANPSVTMTVWPRKNPGSAYNPNPNTPVVYSAQNYAAANYYQVQQFTQQINLRVRGRQMAFRIGSDSLGTAWQLGTMRLETRTDGKRS